METVEGEITAVAHEIKDTEAAVKEVEVAIKEVEAEIKKADADLTKPDISANEQQDIREKLQYLRVEKQQLRTKEQQLRAEKQQLRTKEEQLRAKKLLCLDRPHLRTELEEHERYLKRARTVAPPSQVSLRTEQLHADGPLIKNWRPNENAAGLPPALVDPVFGQAELVIAGGTDLDEATIEVAGKLCCTGAGIYEKEANLTKAVEDLLIPYLQHDEVARIRSGFEQGTSRGQAVTGWSLGDREKNPSNLFLVVEIKLAGHRAGDSHFQGANYLLRFWRDRDELPTFKNTYCPAFLLEVLGPNVRLSAMAWLDRVTIFPLTPLLNLLPADPVDDRLLMSVARLLAAMRAGVHTLAEAHATVHTTAVAVVLPAGRKELPWPIRLDPKYDTEVVKLPERNRNPTYRVRLAGSEGGSSPVMVVVKLCRRYGAAAHRAWAELGLAPPVQRVETLPGGWILVEMEWLPDTAGWRPLSELQVGELNEALGAVTEELKRAHSSTGMVHGDLRPPNCMVRRSAEGPGPWQVRFVDFEWSGRRGEATYPACLNPEIPWPAGVGYGKQLQFTHDLELLAATARQAGAGSAQQ